MHLRPHMLLPCTATHCIGVVVGVATIIIVIVVVIIAIAIVIVIIIVIDGTGGCRSGGGVTARGRIAWITSQSDSLEDRNILGKINPIH